MIFYQNTNQKLNHQSNDNLKNQSTKNDLYSKQNMRKRDKQKQKVLCSCFRSSNSNFQTKMDDLKFRPSINNEMKEQALKLSRQIASSSFKNLRNANLSPKNSLSNKDSIQSNAIDSPNIQVQLKKEKSFQKLKKKQNLAQMSNKDEFNMSRITFSVINRSYEKTANTVASNNTSISLDSNILGSIVSQVKNQSQKTKLLKQSHDESFSSISSLTKRSAGLKNPVVEINSKKRIKHQKTTPIIESIKQQNEQGEMKRYKFIRVNSKHFPPKSTKILQNPKFQIQKIITQEELVSSPDNEEDQNIRYDQSQILIDFFNIEAQKLQTLKSQRKIQKQTELYQTKNQKGNTFRDNSFSSLISQNQINSLSRSNLRQISIPNSVLSESNVLSGSINNYSQFSCSFESIAKKDVKWGYRVQGFDGLSCINQNQQSQVWGHNEDSEINEVKNNQQ